MRNLKRALSLTLASVMLLGMMIVGTSAVSFNDADDISNVTAATVLQELKVMQGTGGNFAPNETVTRGQMAILICKILYGDKLNVSQFAGTTMFDDVPANSYFTGYVNLAAQLGIISGYGNGQFGPGDPVTTAQAALMLTRALGWFQGGELKGQNWGSNALAAVSQATKLDMFGDLRLGINDPLSRDNVAEMVFNTMTKAVPVQYSERWDTYYTNEGSVMSGVKFDYRNSLGYKNFTLVYTDSSDKDDFGRPAIVWGIGNGKITDSDINDDGHIKENSNVVIKDEIITAPKVADKVYVGEVKSKDIYDDLNMRADLAAGKVSVYEDSKSAVKTKTINKDDVSDAGKYGKDGQTVEIWYTRGDKSDGSEDTATVVITSSYLGIVTDASYRENGKDGIRVNVFGMGLKFIEASGYQKNDVLLVNMSGTDLKAIVGTPKTVEGEATQVGVSSEAHRSLTIDGKKYNQSVKFTSGDGDVVDGESNSDLGIEKTYTLYLDQNDCFLAAVEVEDNSSTDLVYLFRAYKGSAMDGDEIVDKAMATVVYMDGTYKTVALTKINGTKVTNALSESGTLESNNKGALVELKYDEDDKEYDLVTTVDRYTVKNGSPSATVDLDADTRYETLVNGQGSVYLNGDTVYVFVAPDTTDPNKIDNVKVVTGGVDFDIANTTKVAYATGKSNTTARYVVIQAEYEAGSDDVVYIKSSAKRDIVDGVIYEGYFATSATETDIQVDKSTTTYRTLSEGFYTYSTKTNGNLKLTAADNFSSKTKAGKASGVITSMEKDDKGYLMTVNGTTFDLKDVVVIDKTDKDKAAENAYKSNVNDQSLLKSVVDQKVDGFTQYAVNVAIYANKDAEVTALVITSITEAPRSIDSGSQSAEQINNALSGGKTVNMGSSATLSGSTTITEGTLVLNNSGNLNGQTLTVKSGAAVEVKANQSGTIALDGGTVKLDGVTSVPTFTGSGKVEVARDIAADITNVKSGTVANGTKDTVVDVTNTAQGVELTGDGKLTTYSDTKSMSELAAYTDSTTFRAMDFKVTTTQDKAGTNIKTTYYTGSDTSNLTSVASDDWKTPDADYGTGHRDGLTYTPAGGNETVTFYVGDKVTGVRITVTTPGESEDGEATVENFYFKIK